MQLEILSGPPPLVHGTGKSRFYHPSQFPEYDSFPFVSFDAAQTTLFNRHSRIVRLTQVSANGEIWLDGWVRSAGQLISQKTHKNGGSKYSGFSCVGRIFAVSGISQDSSFVSSSQKETGDAVPQVASLWFLVQQHFLLSKDMLCHFDLGRQILDHFSCAVFWAENSWPLDPVDGVLMQAFSDLIPGNICWESFVAPGHSTEDTSFVSLRQWVDSAVPSADGFIPHHAAISGTEDVPFLQEHVMLQIFINGSICGGHLRHMLSSGQQVVVLRDHAHNSWGWRVLFRLTASQPLHILGLLSGTLQVLDEFSNYFICSTCVSCCFCSFPS